MKTVKVGNLIHSQVTGLKLNKRDVKRLEVYLYDLLDYMGDSEIMGKYAHENYSTADIKRHKRRMNSVQSMIDKLS